MEHKYKIMYRFTKYGNNTNKGVEMSFIGIISENKSFETIKSNLLNGRNSSKWNIIRINLQSIENIKNIKFDIVVIDSDIKKLEERKELLDKICGNCKYILLNTDLNNEEYFKLCKEVKIVTYGLNSKATFTVSSITDDHIIIYLQQNIKDIEGNILEIGEKRIDFTEQNKVKTYEILVIVIILLLNSKKIMEKI